MDLAALKSALRAAIVIPAVFAFADKVIAQPQTSVFTALGSFAMLVLVEFAGPARKRLAAYLGLGCLGALLITLGTVCSRNPWLAAGAMAVVGFVVLFSGVVSGYFAAGGTAAILPFVLAVTIPAHYSAIPDRLEGWGLAVAAGTLAAMLLWPPRRRADVEHDAADTIRAVADYVEAGVEQSAERGRAARNAVQGLSRRFLGSQFRPTGPTGPTAALASIPDELDWLLSSAAPDADSPQLVLACTEDGEALSAAAAVLRASAERLDGRDVEPDFARLEHARDSVVQALLRRLPALPADMGDDVIPRSLAGPFRIRLLIYSARQVARSALRATGADDPEPALASLAATEHVAVEQASLRSVWFQNSVRGAAGLAIAVYIAQRTGLQHSFWVVLGTLSVLRSNALGTGWSILSALAGTAVGIVIGALLVIAIGTHEPVLWAVLPFAILLAAYAPRAISFAAGQAGFTVVLFVLFNIIVPVGWKVGLIRVEDVAVGFAISLVVGLLFWPRGAGALVRQDLAAAYARGAEYVLATIEHLIDGARADSAAPAERAADATVHRLEEAFRQYLAERSATEVNVESVAALVSGASRLRRAAQSLDMLGRMSDGHVRLARCGENLDRELQALHSWYVTFGYALVNGRPVPSPHIRDAAGLGRLTACVRDAARSRDKDTLHAAVKLLWASQHLDALWQLEGHLDEQARTANVDLTAAGAIRDSVRGVLDRGRRQLFERIHH